MICMLSSELSYIEKWTGEDLSHYLNKIELIGLRNVSAVLAIWMLVVRNVYIFLPYIMAARTAGIDKSEEIMSLSNCVFLVQSACSLISPPLWACD